MPESRINLFEGVPSEALELALEKKKNKRDRTTLVITIFVAFIIVLEISLIWWASAVSLVSAEIDSSMFFELFAITLILLFLLIVLIKIDSALSVDRDGLMTEIERRKKASE